MMMKSRVNFTHHSLEREFSSLLVIIRDRYKFKHIHHRCNKLVWCPWAWIVLKMMSSKSKLQSFPEESWWRLVLKSWAIPQINDNEVEDDENDDIQMKKRRHQHCCQRSRRRFHQFSRWFLGNYDLSIFILLNFTQYSLEREVNSLLVIIRATNINLSTFTMDAIS